MISDLARLVDVVHREKTSLETSLLKCLNRQWLLLVRKRFGPDRDLEAQFNEDLGEVELFEFRTVVDCC